MRALNLVLWCLAALMLWIEGGLMLSGAANASNCSNYPYTLTNGTTADANQVMANFNNILSCANSNLAHNGANTDITSITPPPTNLAGSGANSNITSLTGLTTPLSIGQGGTASTTAIGARGTLGLGASAVENLSGTISDDGFGNLHLVAPVGLTAGTYYTPTITVGVDGRITLAQTISASLWAWANFVCTNSACTITSALNVGSVTRNNTGLYTVNLNGGKTFTHGIIQCGGTTTANAAGALACGQVSTDVIGTNPGVQIGMNVGGTPTDCLIVCTVSVTGYVSN